MVEEGAEEVHSGMYSVANLVTVLRLLLVPFFFALLIRDSERARHSAFALYVLAASTDWIDGQIARRTHTVTRVGKVIDPLVDRLLLASGVIGLYIIGELPVWIPAVLVLRDVYLLYGSYVLERHRIVLPVTYVGKVTTAVLLTGFSSLIAGWPVISGTVAGLWLVYAGAVLSLVTAVKYTFSARSALNEANARLRSV
ncbi:MAG: CDP-alcohol phosphatidyltransferase family protein [Actinomycetia bacterium]|nr:CDP-alcohol phosphatidyltransferase family protein [Actinomycetes bacterium]